MAYRFNQIYTFCVEFYTGLVKEMAVQEAFDTAFNYVQDEMNNHDIRHGKGGFDYVDLGVPPRLLPTESSKHEKPFFSTEVCSIGNNKWCLKEGYFVEISRRRGPINFKKDELKGVYIGRQSQIYKVVNWLTDTKEPKESIPRVILVKGKWEVGKTRFVKEVGYFLYGRYQFTEKIEYIDLAELDE